MMIKLVAADMDGTLLNSKKELSPNLFNTVNKLRDKGIKVAIASGRQYYNLLKIFEEIKDDLIVISDNGSIVFWFVRSAKLAFKRILFSATIDDTLVLMIFVKIFDI